MFEEELLVVMSATAQTEPRQGQRPRHGSAFEANLIREHAQSANVHTRAGLR
jgi:hypothetical protein